MNEHIFGKKTLLCALALLSSTLTLPAMAGEAEQQAASAVLDALHRHAANADWPAYFNLYSTDAVFIGTDATERWDKAQFRSYAEATKGWTYKPTSRAFVDHGDTLMFDELLFNDKYGVSRGSGALIATPDGWKILQYHLSFPVPNKIAGDVTQRIMQEAAPAQ